MNITPLTSLDDAAARLDYFILSMIIVGYGYGVCGSKRLQITIFQIEQSPYTFLVVIQSNHKGSFYTRNREYMEQRQRWAVDGQPHMFLQNYDRTQPYAMLLISNCTFSSLKHCVEKAYAPLASNIVQSFSPPADQFIWSV